MKDVFDKSVSEELIGRINKLENSTAPVWGKMSVDQMLAHCNVTYDLVFTDKNPKPGAFQRWILKLLVKNVVVNDKPYKKNSRTAPVFLVSDPKNFEEEKKKLVDHIAKVNELGASHFEGKESHSFGPLTKKEWSNMFYKHLDHHLQQFGV